MRSEEEINADFIKFEKEVKAFMTQFAALAQKNRAYFEPIIKKLSDNKLSFEDLNPEIFAAINLVVRIFEEYRSEEKALKQNNVQFSENFHNEMADFTSDVAISHIVLLRIEKMNYVKEIKSCKEKIKTAHKLFAKQGRKDVKLAKAVDGLAKLAAAMQKQIVICNLKIATLDSLIPDEGSVQNASV